MKNKKIHILLAILLSAAVLPTAVFIFSPPSYSTLFAVTTQISSALLLLLAASSWILAFNGRKVSRLYLVVSLLMIFASIIYWLLLLTGLVMDSTAVDCHKYADTCLEAIRLPATVALLHPVTMIALAILAVIALFTVRTSLRKK